MNPVTDTADLDRLVGLYEFVNIKLDKTGGLTEALRLQAAAESKGFSDNGGLYVRKLHWESHRHFLLHSVQKLLTLMHRFIFMKTDLFPMKI